MFKSGNDIYRKGQKVATKGNRLRLFSGPIPAPVPDLDRHFDETLTIILVEDNRLQNEGEFDSVFGGGCDGELQNSGGFAGGIGGGFGGGFGSILVLLFIPFLCWY
ncbi:Hypothetical predicted protein [Mytilus galloprovincialis]|uniref:Uncharacterized protein n=1 Tax=Mytilus galloprovincialis TaxID=29158 RepID=A0A8B6C701_MYTGA|nr:Hypothetical predicted protein [Mytilus galloprovincialis]